MKITRNYQVTIPSSIHRLVGLREGDRVRIVCGSVEGVIKIIPLPRRRATVKLGGNISVEELKETGKLSGIIEETSKAQKRLAEIEKRIGELEGGVRAKRNALKEKAEELKRLKREVDEINRTLRKAFIVK